MLRNLLPDAFKREDLAASIQELTEGIAVRRKGAWRVPQVLTEGQFPGAPGPFRI